MLIYKIIVLENLLKHSHKLKMTFFQYFSILSTFAQMFTVPHFQCLYAHSIHSDNCHHHQHQHKHLIDGQWWQHRVKNPQRRHTHAEAGRSRTHVPAGRDAAISLRVLFSLLFFALSSSGGASARDRCDLLFSSSSSSSPSL